MGLWGDATSYLGPGQGQDDYDPYGDLSPLTRLIAPGIGSAAQGAATPPAEPSRRMYGHQVTPETLWGAVKKMFAGGEAPPDVPNPYSIEHYVADPTARSDEDIQRTAEHPPTWGQSIADLGHFVGNFVPGGGPAGALTAGARLTPEQQAFAETLRAAHLGRDNPLPLAGATAPVTPPPHITTTEAFDALVSRNADLVQGGWVGRPWYIDSGGAIHYHTGGDEPLSTAFSGGASRTSPGTDVASNATHAITLHNQAMAGDPLFAGRFPNAMGGDVSRYYYGGDTPAGGIKTGPFLNAIGSDVWLTPERIAASPNPHTFVNDIWNMRASEFPGEGGGIYTRPLEEGQKLYEGTPSLGEHNFTRMVNTATRDEVERRMSTGNSILFEPETIGAVRLRPEEVQAPSWTGIKSKVEGTPPEEAGMSFEHGLRGNYGQLSWESAPGETAVNHFPEYAAATPEQKAEFHQGIRDIFTDSEGRDVIAQHLGLLTGRTFDAPGYFKGISNPGSQSQVALGQAPGGWKMGLDPSSRTLADTSELVRGLVLRQDAVAYHKPMYMGEAGLSPKYGNLVDVNIGRSLTPEETIAVAKDMHARTGTDFFSPIGTENGFRFYNIPEYSGVKNADFQRHVGDVASSNSLPDHHITDAHADGGYFENNWKDSPNGEAYFKELGGKGSPDLQRAVKELLATLGKKVGDFEDVFAAKHGWTPDRSTRFWETNPDLQAHGGAVVPSPRRPWQNPPPGLLTE